MSELYMHKLPKTTDRGRATCSSVSPVFVLVRDLCFVHILELYLLYMSSGSRYFSDIFTMAQVLAQMTLQDVMGF
jgi:hypothetical protein